MAKRTKESQAANMGHAEGSAQEPSIEPAPPGAEGGEPGVPSVDDLQERLQEAERQNQDLLTRLQYAQADLENVRKRADREVIEATRYANERLIASLLPVLDEFDAAVATVQGDQAKGLSMIREDLLQALRAAGLEEVPTSGTFDPYLHEAVGRVNDETLEDGTIKDVVQKGYRFNVKLLRPAKVIVVRKGGES